MSPASLLLISRTQLTALALEPGYLQFKLRAYSIPDPEIFVQQVRATFRSVELHEKVQQIKPKDRQSYYFPSVIKHFVERLLKEEGGRRLAFEFCFVIKLDGSMVHYEPAFFTRNRDPRHRLQNRALDKYIEELQMEFCECGKARDKLRVSTEAIDPTAARRRL